MSTVIVNKNKINGNMIINNELKLIIKNETQYEYFKNPKSSHNAPNIYKKYKKIIDNVVNFLESDNKSERLYCYINNITENVKCHRCKEKYSKFNCFTLGYSIYCCARCRSLCENYNKAWTDNYFKKTGFKRPLQNPIIQKEINKKSKTKEANKKKEITCLDKYGVKNPMQSEGIKQKQKNTYFKRTGYTTPLQNPAVIEKKKNNYFKKTGYNYPLQNPEVFEKQQSSSFKYKEYKFPSGKIVKVQGYENFALDILINIYNEEDLITSVIHMPDIWYYNNNKKHKYYPDIFIKSENKFIEVKSTYTYNDMKEISTLKQQACKNLGYEHKIWIIDKANLIKEI